MATGWAGDGAVQDQIDATIKDGIQRVRAQLPQGQGLERCDPARGIWRVFCKPTCKVRWQAQVQLTQHRCVLTIRSQSL